MEVRNDVCDTILSADNYYCDLHLSCEEESKRKAPVALLATFEDLLCYQEKEEAFSLLSLETLSNSTFLLSPVYSL